MSIDEHKPEEDRRIVVGVDGSESSLRALDWAARQAGLTDCELDVIITWSLPPAFAAAAAYSYPQGWDPQAESEAKLEEIMIPLRHDHPAVNVNPQVMEGHAAPLLVEASRGAELLVVGSRGHGEFAGMLLGSVSQHCVANAHCPVLVLRDRH